MNFEINWALPNRARIDERNRRILKLTLNSEWAIVCVVYGSSFTSWEIHSIEIHRENTAGKFSVSAELAFATHRSELWKKEFSQLIKPGSSITEIASNINSKIYADKIHSLRGHVNISDMSEKQTTNFTKGSKAKILLNSLIELSNDFQRLLDPKTSFFVDVILKCGGASIPAHKIILAARSPVFAAMFSSPMKESYKNEVGITDIDVSTLRDLLIYIYTGKAPDLSTSSASDLLFAADKYQLKDLKTLCSLFLKDNVSLKNVVRILVLGEMHSEYLKSVAIDYICNNCDEFSVLEKTEEWKTLRKERPILAVDVLTSVVNSRDEKLKRYKN